jgi:hypothetical protein
MKKKIIIFGLLIIGSIASSSAFNYTTSCGIVAATVSKETFIAMGGTAQQYSTFLIELDNDICPSDDLPGWFDFDD